MLGFTLFLWVCGTVGLPADCVGYSNWSKIITSYDLVKLARLLNHRLKCASCFLTMLLKELSGLLL